MNGTGNKNIKIDGNPAQINFQLGKVLDDGQELTAELVINNTVIENQTINSGPGENSIDIEHVF